MARKNVWNTHAIRGYTHDVAGDQASAGGVHLHQVRCVRGTWQTRVLQSTGRHRAAGTTSIVTAAEGEALYAAAVAGL